MGGKEADLAGGGTKSGGAAADVTKCDRRRKKELLLKFAQGERNWNVTQQNLYGIPNRCKMELRASFMLPNEKV